MMTRPANADKYIVAEFLETEIVRNNLMLRHISLIVEHDLFYGFFVKHGVSSNAHDKNNTFLSN